MRACRLITVLTLAACGTDVPDAAPAPAAADSTASVATEGSPQSDSSLIDPSANADSISDSQRFIVFGLRSLGRDQQELTASLGTPDSVTYELVQNRHDPQQTDSIASMFFRTANATLYVGNDRAIVVQLTVLDNAHLRLPGPRIGMTRDEVIAFMGAPEAVEGPVMRWSCNVCVVDQQLVVRMDNDRVSSVGFAYYVD